MKHIKTSVLLALGLLAMGTCVLASDCETADAPEAAVEAAVAMEAPTVGDAAAIELALPVWDRHCAKCHGKDGNGAESKIGAKMGLLNYRDPAALEKFTDEELTAATRDGVEGTKMKGYSDKLSPEEISALTALIRSFSAD